MAQQATAISWAQAEFGSAKLGHAARTKRAVAMAAGMARRPAGKVTQVYSSDADRQGAYDFLENSEVSAEALLDSMIAASLKRCLAYRFVYVPVDGSSLSFADHTGKKEIGSVGSASNGGRGLKVITAYGVGSDGIPVGVLGQTWWARKERVKAKKRGKERIRNAKRKTCEKETQRWIDTIEKAAALFSEQGTRAWFQLDREGDGQAVLTALAASGQWFTVRARVDRRLTGPRVRYLREHLAKQPVLGTYELSVSAGPHRAARTAKMSVRAAKVELRLRDQWNNQVTTLEVTAVWAKEVWTTPKGEKSIDWLLLTNREVATFQAACAVIDGYAIRWRIEELHKTWKTGGCHVEDAQLHSKTALIKWATFSVAVATRIERLKLLARESPKLPASEELSSEELQALLLLKEQQKKRTETIHDNPTIEEAVRWLADLGGYTGKTSSGGPPGAITIGRGLHDVMVAAATLSALAEKRRKK